MPNSNRNSPSNPSPIIISHPLHDANTRLLEASTSEKISDSLAHTGNLECRLIAGWLAMSAQIVLLIVVITALTAKR